MKTFFIIFFSVLYVGIVIVFEKTAFTDDFFSKTPKWILTLAAIFWPITALTFFVARFVIAFSQIIKRKKK